MRISPYNCSKERKSASCGTKKQEKYNFAVADIVQVLTDSADVKQYIKRMRARDPELNSKWGTICTPVEMPAADGKRRLTDVVKLKNQSLRKKN